MNTSQQKEQWFWKKHQQNPKPKQEWKRYLHIWKKKKKRQPPTKQNPPSMEKQIKRPQPKPHNNYCQSLLYISYTAKNQNQNNFP